MKPLVKNKVSRCEIGVLRLPGYYSIKGEQRKWAQCPICLWPLTFFDDKGSCSRCKANWKQIKPNVYEKVNQERTKK